MGLSVAIVAMNEEAIIGQTLESVRWADEIVLVDSGSTDRTCDIARQYGAKVLLRAWPGFSQQKSYAFDNCTQDWILSLDADEVVTLELAEEIRAVIGNPNALNAYWIPRKNLFLGKWTRFGGFYPDPKLRLFRRGRGFMTGAEPHPRIDLKPGFDQRTERLKNPMVHDAYPTLASYMAHMNRYSSTGAKAAVAEGHRGFSILDIVLRPMATFIYNYFFRLGFLDGREGLLLHLYHAVYVSNKYAKVWELTKASSSAKDRS
ncbi:MAG: glycosyltransferase family 2 protein [Candidatus Korobacteraceae bacterium]